MTSHFHSFTNREVSVVAYYNVGACSPSLVFLQGCSHCCGHACYNVHRHWCSCRGVHIVVATPVTMFTVIGVLAGVFTLLWPRLLQCSPSLVFLQGCSHCCDGACSPSLVFLQGCSHCCDGACSLSLVFLQGCSHCCDGACSPSLVFLQGCSHCCGHAYYNVHRHWCSCRGVHIVVATPITMFTVIGVLAGVFTLLWPRQADWCWCWTRRWWRWTCVATSLWMKLTEWLTWALKRTSGQSSPTSRSDLLHCCCCCGFKLIGLWVAAC